MITWMARTLAVGAGELINDELLPTNQQTNNRQPATNNRQLVTCNLQLCNSATLQPATLQPCNLQPATLHSATRNWYFLPIFAP